MIIKCCGRKRCFDYEPKKVANATSPRKRKSTLTPKTISQKVNLGALFSPFSRRQLEELSFFLKETKEVPKLAVSTPRPAPVTALSPGSGGEGEEGEEGEVDDQQNISTSSDPSSSGEAKLNLPSSSQSPSASPSEEITSFPSSFGDSLQYTSATFGVSLSSSTTITSIHTITTFSDTSGGVFISPTTSASSSSSYNLTPSSTGVSISSNSPPLLSSQTTTGIYTTTTPAPVSF